MCPICGANCKCKRRGEGGICCGCHKHRTQKGMSRAQLDDWRIEHRLDPVSDRQWNRSYAKDAVASLHLNDQQEVQ